MDRDGNFELRDMMIVFGALRTEDRTPEKKKEIISFFESLNFSHEECEKKWVKALELLAKDPFYYDSLD